MGSDSKFLSSEAAGVIIDYSTLAAGAIECGSINSGSEPHTLRNSTIS